MNIVLGGAMRKKFLTPFSLLVATLAMGQAEANIASVPLGEAKEVMEAGMAQQERSSIFDFVLKNSDTQGIMMRSHHSHRSHGSHGSHRSHYSSRH